MSIARGILSGFLKEGLEQKAARDELYADMVMETGREFKKTAALFRQDEKNIEKRFNLIQAAHGPNAALYASYNGLTTSDAGTSLVIDTLNKDPNKKKEIDEFDFQGYGFNTAKSSRAINFKDQQKDAINLITKNQGSGSVAELFFKDMKTMDTGTEVTRPELKLPSLSSGGGSSISPSDMRQFRSSAFTEFKAMEKDEFMKEFKDTFAKGYDSEKHGPSKDLYSFERYFNEFYLPGIIGNKTSKTMDTQMQDMGATTTATQTGTATEGAQTTGTTTTSTPFEGDIVDYSSDNPQYFSYNGKLYNVPERFIKKTDSDPKAQELLNIQNERGGTNFTLPEFTVQSLPEITKKAIAAQQDKQPPTKNNPNVLAAQQTINIIRAQNPNDPRIDDIKRDLRLILGVTNLDGLIS
jgi:hypothetical protein